jgi:hypothetical protein
LAKIFLKSYLKSQCNDCKIKREIQN